jgi:hypothetical protein
LGRKSIIIYVPYFSKKRRRAAFFAKGGQWRAPLHFTDSLHTSQLNNQLHFSSDRKLAKFATSTEFACQHMQFFLDSSEPPIAQRSTASAEKNPEQLFSGVSRQHLTFYQFSRRYSFCIFAVK